MHCSTSSKEHGDAFTVMGSETSHVNSDGEKVLKILDAMQASSVSFESLVSGSTYVYRQSCKKKLNVAQFKFSIVFYFMMVDIL